MRRYNPRKRDASILLGSVIGKTDISQGEKAEELILRGIRILDELKANSCSLVGRFYLGDLYAELGRKEEALRTLKSTEAELQKAGLDYWLRRTQEVLKSLEI